MRRAVRERLYPIFACGLVMSVAASACDKAPLLAPGGTVIFLQATAASVPASGSVNIIATLIENGSASSGTDSTTTPAAGTPVHNGTLVSFTTTIGRIEPAEAQTQNGKVTVKFIGDGRSGAATILAHSGGARTEITLNVGGAAAERVQVTSTPVGSSGGASTIVARVEDASGNPLSNVSVQFSATRGTLSASSALTDATGAAQVTLTTTQESTVTATVGSKAGTTTVTPAARSGLQITAPPTITASSPAQFTIGVTTGANVSNVRVEWGDGGSRNLGSITSSATPQHTYSSGGTYTVTATATMADGSVESVSVPVSVGEFSVSLSATPQTTTAGNLVSFTAAVTPNTTQISEYRWTAERAGVATHQRTTTSGSTQFEFTVPGTYTVTVSVVPVTGGTRSTSTTVIVNP